jgi:hypothetical protein
MNQIKSLDLKGRLKNYKFKSALNYLDGEDEEVVELVKSLAAMYGNVGWFEGYSDVIISNALENIGVYNTEPDTSVQPDVEEQGEVEEIKYPDRTFDIIAWTESTTKKSVKKDFEKLMALLPNKEKQTFFQKRVSDNLIIKGFIDKNVSDKLNDFSIDIVANMVLNLINETGEHFYILPDGLSLFIS